MQRLLVISCSQRKTFEKRLVPAVDRYDGPAFRVLRKYLRESWDPDLCVLILSAKFGLVPAERKLPYYDHRLTRQEALAMRPKVIEQSRQTIGSVEWAAIGLCASREYRVAFGDLSDLSPSDLQVDVISGGLGRRLTGLRDWLRRSKRSGQASTSEIAAE